MLNNINKFLDAYIWSQEVKDLIKKENHQFTDRDMAAIVWNDCVKPLAIRHSALRKIIEYSDDGELKIQIEDRITYDAHGEIITYYSNELSKDRYIAINTLSNKRFENAYVVIPNPFEYGDRVTFRNSEKLGTIATRKEQWNSLIRKGIQTDSIFDWSDASVVVEWDDGSHSHINPIYLRKIDNNRCKIIPLFSIYCYNIIVFGVLYNQIRACRKENGK